MVNLKYFTYLIGDEAEALLDRIEEGAIMKKPSTFTIDTQFILTSSSVAIRHLPSEPVSSIKLLNRPNFWRSQIQFHQHRGYVYLYYSSDTSVTTIEHSGHPNLPKSSRF
jgi:hypothetical protein